MCGTVINNMAVIIRETREIAGHEREVKVYRTDGPLTQEEKKKAEELDEFLEGEMEKLIDDLRERGLIKQVGSQDALELWYTVGTHLDFVSNTDIISTQDRKYVWRALYDHAGPLHLKESIPKRVEQSPKTSHFYYCYLLGKFDWETVKSGEIWTTWLEIFDSKPVRQDERITEWLVDSIDQHEGGIQEWVRPLNKAIRNKFENKDTTVFSDEELQRELNQILEDVHGTDIGD